MNIEVIGKFFLIVLVLIGWWESNLIINSIDIGFYDCVVRLYDVLCLWFVNNFFLIIWFYNKIFVIISRKVIVIKEIVCY